MSQPRPSRHPVRDKILALPENADRAQGIARLRATAVRDAVQNSSAHNADGVIAVTTPSGQTVNIERVELSPDNAEMAYVDVYLPGHNGEPQYRVINPPTLVEDRKGSITVGDTQYREDPLTALAEAISRGGPAR